ncbi:SEC-C domain-containing protein [Candidatus Woesearchaeota archaeon]|nr:SEC-C domain-containing protein [Candidatus Woesearchaeota archaeon]
MASLLDARKLEYFGPERISRFKGENLKRKLGRNDPCHCGSGTKYKKCCLDNDLKETGSPRKVATYY